MLLLLRSVMVGTLSQWWVSCHNAEYLVTMLLLQDLRP